MKKGLKKIAAVCLIVGVLMSLMNVSTFAAYCGVGGSCKGSTTFDVTTRTGVGQSVTVKPSKAGQLWISKSQPIWYQESWANYRITIRRLRGNGYCPGTTYLYGRYAEKIWLGSNSTYRITVTPITYRSSDWKKTCFWTLDTGIGIKSVVMR